MTAAIIPPIAHMDLLVFMVVGFACFYFIYIYIYIYNENRTGKVIRF